MALETTISVGKKKKVFNVKFPVKIQVSVNAGRFTSFLPLTSKLKCQLKLFTVPHFRLS